MKAINYVFFGFLFACAICSCSSSSDSRYVTIVTCDTVNSGNSDCSLTRLYFTTGFENSTLVVNWNNSVIYFGLITTDKIKGYALKSITIPRNDCNLVVNVDNISYSTNPGTKYCNLLFRKSNDTLFLECTNRKPEFD